MSETTRTTGDPTAREYDGPISGGFAAAGHWTPISDAERAQLAADMADLKFYRAMKDGDEGITAGYVPPPGAPPFIDRRPQTHADPVFLNGVLVFTGTRVPVRSLFDTLAAGESLAAFLDRHPIVTRSQAVAAIGRAGELLADRRQPA